MIKGILISVSVLLSGLAAGRGQSIPAGRRGPDRCITYPETNLLSGDSSAAVTDDPVYEAGTAGNIMPAYCFSLTVITLPVFIFLLILMAGCSNYQFDRDNPGSFADSRDNNRYGWIKIGEQVWMSENLAYLPSVSPSSYGSVNEPYFYVYGFESTDADSARKGSNYTLYGVLYNWAASMTACPAGWHLPADNDWKVLEKYLGMNESDANAVSWRNSGNVGGMLKDTGLLLWSGSNAGATNSSSFRAIPGGCRYSHGGFTSLGDAAFFWTATENDSVQSWHRGLTYAGTGILRGGYYRSNGMSVRCMKD